MSSRPLKTYAEGAASVDIPIDAILEQASAYLDKITDAVASEILKKAKVSAAFVDRSGKLRESGKRRKSRFNVDEKIVAFTAPHAHLVEHGHLMLKHDGTPTTVDAWFGESDHVPASPFLGPARDEVKDDLPNIIRRIVPPKIKVGR